LTRKEKYLKGLLSGSLNGAWGFTESGTGSEPKQFQSAWPVLVRAC